MQRGAVERHSGHRNALAERGKQLAIVGQKAAFGEQPAIQARRCGGERVLTAFGKPTGRRRICARRDHRNGAATGTDPGTAGSVAGVIVVAGDGGGAEFTALSWCVTSSCS